MAVAITGLRACRDADRDPTGAINNLLAAVFLLLDDDAAPNCLKRATLGVAAGVLPPGRDADIAVMVPLIRPLFLVAASPWKCVARSKGRNHLFLSAPKRATIWKPEDGLDPH